MGQTMMTTPGGKPQRQWGDTRIAGQLFRFGVAGGASFAIDYGLFILIFRVFGVHYIIAAGISFAVAVVFNWIINSRWVFTEGARVSHKGVEVLVFVGIAVVGLGVNEAVLWAGVMVLGVRAEVAKLAATAVVAVWNFLLRKILLYH